MKTIIMILLVSYMQCGFSCTNMIVRGYFDGEVMNDKNISVIKIDKNKIVGISNKKTHDKCKEVNLSSYYAIPGLIDTHTLIFASDSTFGDDYSIGVLNNRNESKKVRFDRAYYRLKQYINHGFTTIRELGNSGQYYDVEISEIINKQNSNDLYPQIYTSGPGISAVGGQFPLGTNYKIVADEYDQVRDTKQIDSLIKNRLRRKTQTLKLYADNDPNPNRFDEEVIKLLVKKAKLNKLKVAIHATDEKSISTAIEAKPDSIEHAYSATIGQLKLMRDKNIILVPTDKGRDIIEKINNNVEAVQSKNYFKQMLFDENKSKNRMAHAVEANVKIAFGSDFYFPVSKLGMPFISGVYSSLFSLKEYGLSNEKVLQASTKNAAELLGNNQIGQIKVGYIADIVIVDGDPTKDLSNIKKINNVIHNGKIVARNEK